MRSTLTALGAVLLVACDGHRDPAFVTQSGDLEAFIDQAIPARYAAAIYDQARPISTWSSRVLTDADPSGAYLAGREAIQIATMKTNFSRLQLFLTRRLGVPPAPLTAESWGRHVGWSTPDGALGIWLTENANVCRVEIVSEQVKAL